MSPKNPAAVSLGRKGGEARAKNLTPQQRSDAARKAVEARWAKMDKALDKLEKQTTRTEATINELVRLNRANRRKAAGRKKVKAGK